MSMFTELVQVFVQHGLIVTYGQVWKSCWEFRPILLGETFWFGSKQSVHFFFLHQRSGLRLRAHRFKTALHAVSLLKLKSLKFVPMLPNGMKTKTCWAIKQFQDSSSSAPSMRPPARAASNPLSRNSFQPVFLFSHNIKSKLPFLNFPEVQQNSSQIMGPKQRMNSMLVQDFYAASPVSRERILFKWSPQQQKPWYFLCQCRNLQVVSSSKGNHRKGSENYIKKNTQKKTTHRLGPLHKTQNCPKNTFFFADLQRP